MLRSKFRTFIGSPRTPCDGGTKQPPVRYAHPDKLRLGCRCRPTKLHRRTECDGYPGKPKQTSGNSIQQINDHGPAAGCHFHPIPHHHDTPRCRRLIRCDWLRRRSRNRRPRRNSHPDDRRAQGNKEPREPWAVPRGESPTRRACPDNKCVMECFPRRWSEDKFLRSGRPGLRMRVPDRGPYSQTH
jgi:hypothetical protein